MGNMAYCMFQNTVTDLRDCMDCMEDNVSEDEERARKRLIKLCEKIAAEYGEIEPQ